VVLLHFTQKKIDLKAKVVICLDSTVSANHCLWYTHLYIDACLFALDITDSEVASHHSVTEMKHFRPSRLHLSGI
jgi:hypothetical protein